MAWGMTVAPSIEAATSRPPESRRRGMRPAAVADQSGGATTSPPTKPIVTTTSRPTTTPSKVRWLRLSWRARSSMDTAPIRQPPVSSGSPSSRWRAMAPPITSARSVAAATSSAWAQKARRERRPRRSPSTSGSERPVTMPSLALWYWMRTAMVLARTRTHTSE